MFPYKGRLPRSKTSKVIYRASCWDCIATSIGKSIKRLEERKKEHFEALSKDYLHSELAKHITDTGHRIKWDNF